MSQNPSNSCSWTASPNGLFTLASAWTVVRSLAPIFPLADTIWFPGHTPKWFYCILRAMYDRLPTSTRLKKFLIVNTDTCALCDTGTKITNHLIFACPYAPYFRTLCKLKLGITSPSRELLEEAAKIKMKFKHIDKS